MKKFLAILLAMLLALSVAGAALAQVDLGAIRAQAEKDTPAITPYETKQPPAWLTARIATVTK